MVTQLGLVLGGVAAALTIAAALALGAVTQTPAQPALAAAPAAAAAPASSPSPTVQVDTVYLPAPVPPQTVIVQRQAAPGGGEHEGGEGGESAGDND